MLKWQDKYSIGIPTIDEQHKKLFDIANEASTLLNLPSHTDKYDDIIGLIDELRDYTVFHFDTEQKFMVTIGYPKMFSHKVEHDDFISKITQVDLHTVDTDQDAYLLEIIDFIINWVVTHIVERDPEIAKWYNEFYGK